MNALIIALLIAIIIAACLATLLRLVVQKLKSAKGQITQIAEESNRLHDKYKDVIDLEDLKSSLSNTSDALQSQIAQQRELNTFLTKQADTLRSQIALYNGEETVIDCGLYTPVYDFDISQKYKDALLAVRDQQKEMLKQETAIIVSQTWTVNGNISEGKKMVRNYSRVMLRAFNGESDSIMTSVRWNNLQRMIDRLENTYQAVNKLGETQQILIQRIYFQLKLKELHLSYEYAEKLEAEREEQRKMRERIRDEEKAQKELDEQVRRSQEAERQSQIALQHARLQLQATQGAQVPELSARIQELEKQLAEKTAIKERDISRANTPLSGFVYVISNVGSFGENRFKIGMTRRPDPHDRIDELGGASVPFDFDVHAIISTENARQLEVALHNKLSPRRVNLINQRKEFFDTSVDEIEAAVREFDKAVEVIRIPEAKMYRQSLALREQQKKANPQPPALPQPDYQVYVSVNGNQEGPYSFPELNQRIVQGLIDPNSALMWYQGMPGWNPIKQFQQG